MDEKELQTSSVGNHEDEETEKEYPPLKVVIPAMLALYLAVFLVALDRTIIGTAIPSITEEFDSFGDVAWYESGFLLPLCALQLTFGRVYMYYSTKWLLFGLVALFEIGSIVCAAAPNSNALIVGRVVSGIGAAGTTTGVLLMITLLVPLQSRPQWQGGFGAIFGISSILGPILGGFLTSVTWRWCFYINLPIGAVSLVVLFWLTPNKAPPAKVADSWKGKILQLDPVGFVLIALSIIGLLFALQWGPKYDWKDGRVIAMFVVFGVFALLFVGWQAWRKDEGTVPPRILFQRSILAGCVASIGIGTVIIVLNYYLPIWFQVIQGKTPQASGVALIALLLSNVIAVIAGGIATSKFGYYTPFMIAGGAILIVGSALISTWQVHTGAGRWIGYQIVAGFGLGLVLQGPNIAAQTVLSDSDVSIGMTVVNFVNFFAGTIFVTVSQVLLETKLTDGLKDLIPGFDPSTVVNGGAASIRNEVSAGKLPAVLRVYNDSMRSIWYLALGLSCLVFLAAFGMEWKSVKHDKKKDTAGEAAIAT